jgi:phytoene desaturase
MSVQMNVIVIGAGLGGIATAARLAQQGYHVTVLEKNETPGGRCSQVISNGHRFDIGATLLLMPEVFRETYADLGEHMEEHLHLRRIDPTYQVHFADNSHLSLTGDLYSMLSQVEAIEPGSFHALLRYLAEGRQSYQLSLQHFVRRNFLSFPAYFSLHNLPFLFQMKALIKHYTNVSRYFQNPRLRAAFSFQNMYLGLSPFDAPATYSLIQYTELANGVWFPVGGLYSVIESLIAIARAKGVQFVYNAPVKRIVVEGDHVNGVELEDGTYRKASVIVANADLPYVYSRLLPESHASHDLEHLKYTCSTFMFYWGVDTIFPQLGTHNVFLADDYRGSFDTIFQQHSLPEKPSFYVHAPSRVDASAAPYGEDTLSVLVPVGHLDPAAPLDWKRLQAHARSEVIHRLAEIGVTDLEKHLKFEMTFTPYDWLNQYNLAKGAAFGLSHNFMQIGYLRPHNKHHAYKNLYFVGSSTHPGTGLPMVLLSARLTTERILNDYPSYQSPLEQRVSPSPVALYAR